MLGELLCTGNIISISALGFLIQIGIVQAPQAGSIEKIFGAKEDLSVIQVIFHADIYPCIQLMLRTGTTVSKLIKST